MPASPPSPKKHILLIEDEAQIRTALQRFVTLSGYAVTSVGTGAEGFKQLAALTPDLILLDLSLPESDGLVVLRELHEKFPMIKVVLLADANDVPKAQMALNFGARDYLAKPVDLPTMKHMLHVHLSRR